MRGVVVQAALVLAILAPALVQAEEDLPILGDVWAESKPPQRGDMAGDQEVSQFRLLKNNGKRCTK